jgi:hypothetical protein
LFFRNILELFRNILDFLFFRNVFEIRTVFYFLFFSSGTTVSLTPSPPPITSTTASQAMVEQPFVGQHLLMALSKAREAFRLNQFS